MDTRKKAILVVSFGTSYIETMQKNILAIETKIKEAFPKYSHYHAWTCERVIRKVKKSHQIFIPTIEEAMMQMIHDGITDVIIQPTHLIDGSENERLQTISRSFQKDFSTMVFGLPLLGSIKDIKDLAAYFHSAFYHLSETEALIMMGHGSSTIADQTYTVLNQSFQEFPLPQIFVGTMENKDSIHEIIDILKTKNIKKVFLTPLLIVCGIHAEHNMAGSQSDSWKSQLEQAGFEVSCLMKGLGEYSFVCSKFIEHIKNQEISG